LCARQGCGKLLLIRSCWSTPLRSYISLIVVFAFFVLLGVVRYLTRYVPSPEEEEFNKKFDREAVLVKTCGIPPGIATAVPIQVFRFDGKLWYDDFHRWRQIDATPENVCDRLDIEKGHEPKPGPLPPGWTSGR
jgi:hypothetical protein